MKPIPLPGLRRADHLGFTVPDLEEAHAFLTDVIGCEYLYELGPFSGESIEQRLGVVPGTVMRRLRFYRLSGETYLEVFEYDAVAQSRTPPNNSDVGGHHLAMYVEDLDAAVATLRAHGVEMMGEPTSSTGPSAGQRWIYFRSPWGMQFELVSYPQGKAFENEATPVPRP